MMDKDPSGSDRVATRRMKCRERRQTNATWANEKYQISNRLRLSYFRHCRCLPLPLVCLLCACVCVFYFLSGLLFSFLILICILAYACVCVCVCVLMRYVRECFYLIIASQIAVAQVTNQCTEVSELEWKWGLSKYNIFICSCSFRFALSFVAPSPFPLQILAHFGIINIKYNTSTRVYLFLLWLYFILLSLY